MTFVNNAISGFITDLNSVKNEFNILVISVLGVCFLM